MELKAYLSVLLIKGCSFSNRIEEFQEEIKRKFNKEYSLQEIEDELIVMKLEQDNNLNEIIEIPEDY